MDDPTGMKLSARDIFEMAEQIESDAAVFYRSAAEATSDPTRRDLLRELATMELGHEGVFAGMKSLLPDAPPAPKPPDKAGADPDDIDWSGLTTLLASGVREHLAERFTGRETSNEILRKAIEFERDTIVFFANVKALLPGPEVARRIDEVLAEELGHILSLSGQLVANG